MVSVPTHFYKVILVEPKDQGDCAVAAFVMPNQSIPSDVPLTRFAVPITDLEAATGLSFFPTYLSDSKKIALDRGAIIWRSIGKALYGETDLPLLPAPDDPHRKAIKTPKVKKQPTSQSIEGKDSEF